MVMMTDKQREQLNAGLPREWVAERDGGGGRKLSYIAGWRVIDELNNILGPGGWSYAVAPTQAVPPIEGVDKYGKPQWRVTYTSLCTLVVPGCTITDVGAGHGIDRDLGQAIESAIKEAATDALKRCAKSLGRRLGLALYDKEQQFVEQPPRTDDEQPIRTAEERKADRREETGEQKAARQAEHHPSWKGDQARFCARLKSMNLDVDDVAAFSEWAFLTHGKGSGKRPSQMDNASRAKLIGFLEGPEGQSMYREFVIGVSGAAPSPDLDPDIPF